MNIVASSTYINTSTWTRPMTGTPTFVADGVLKGEHYQGRPFVQVWSKTAAYAPGFFDSKMNFLGGGKYWLPAVMSAGPIVVLPWGNLPLTMDASMPIGKSVWPVAPFTLQGQSGLDVTINAEGDYGASVVEMFDCTNCKVTLNLRGTGAWLLVNKGLVNMERCVGCIVEVVCGTSAGQTIVRGLGVQDPNITVHSGASAMGRAWDAGKVYLSPRFRTPAGETVSGGNGVVSCFARSLIDQTTDRLRDFGLNQPHCSVYLDDWYKGALVKTVGDCYVCGPDNMIGAYRTIFDLRQGTGWDTVKKLYVGKQPTDLRGTLVDEGETVVMK